MDNLIPVNPHVENGVLSSLVPLVGAEHAKPVPDAPEQPLESFRVTFRKLDFSFATALNLGGIFSASGGYSETAAILDAGIYRDVRKGGTLPPASVRTTRWGVSLRILMRITTAKVEALTNYQAIAAQVELNRADVHYEVTSIGSGIALMPRSLKVLPILGKLDLQALSRLNEVIEEFGTLVAQQDAAGSLRPRPLAVAFGGLPPDPLDHGCAIRYAMRSIAAGKSQATALAGAGELSRWRIEQVYADVSNRAKAAHKTPRDYATAWLKV